MQRVNQEIWLLVLLVLMQTSGMVQAAAIQGVDDYSTLNHSISKRAAGGCISDGSDRACRRDPDCCYGYICDLPPGLADNFLLVPRDDRIDATNLFCDDGYCRCVLAPTTTRPTPHPTPRPPCVGQGGLCNFAGDNRPCCYGNCTGVCPICIAAGDNCNVGDRCCHGYCINGRCPTCIGAGGYCDAGHGLPCCYGNCADGVCPSRVRCRDGASCHSDDDCACPLGIAGLATFCCPHGNYCRLYDYGYVGGCPIPTPGTYYSFVGFDEFY